MQIAARLVAAFLVAIGTSSQSVAGQTLGRTFMADKILVKCPSKYESDDKI